MLTHLMLSDLYTKSLQRKLFHNVRAYIIRWKLIEELIQSIHDDGSKEDVENKEKLEKQCIKKAGK